MKEYENIVEDIKNKIIGGELVAGDKLPSIKAMTQIYGVSSITVRNSLSILGNEGYIETRERSGCFVKESENDLFWMYFNEITNIKETILDTEILSISRIFDFNGLEDFGEEADKKIQTVKIRRIFKSFLEAPVSYDIKYLLHHSRGDTKKMFYYDNLRRIDYFLEKEIDKTLEIRMIQPTREIVDILKIPENAPVFYFKQKYYDKHGHLVAVGQTYTIADSIQVTATSRQNA
ncbi:MAG: GntR family transcriptional regulator [Eubacterium sp.]|nr:GntR family transcriptional regulator [Eubacterium sp.]